MPGIPETPGCYCMALSQILGEAGRKIGSSQITVKGTVPGIDKTTFKNAGVDAKNGCPISTALKRNVELSVEATLA
jgi:osmotically inducible protein OsmC